MRLAGRKITITLSVSVSLSVCLSAELALCCWQDVKSQQLFLSLFLCLYVCLLNWPCAVGRTFISNYSLCLSHSLARSPTQWDHPAKLRNSVTCKSRFDDWVSVFSVLSPCSPASSFSVRCLGLFVSAENLTCFSVKVETEILQLIVHKRRLVSVGKTKSRSAFF